MAESLSMSALSDFARMPVWRKRRAVRCLWEVTRASIVIRTTRADRLVDLLGAPARSPADASTTPPVDDETSQSAAEVGRVISRSARVLPWHPTCLRQAVAASRVLDRAAVPHRIHLGIVDATTLGAHAWVTVGDRVVVGDNGHRDHTPVAVFDRGIAP